LRNAILWILAYGLLGTALLAWFMGVPPPSMVFGVKYYPQMAISLYVVIFAMIMNTKLKPPSPSI
jgi:FtsH-binding integral membrane protein